MECTKRLHTLIESGDNPHILPVNTKFTVLVHTISVESLLLPTEGFKSVHRTPLGSYLFLKFPNTQPVGGRIQWIKAEPKINKIVGKGVSKKIRKLFRKKILDLYENIIFKYQNVQPGKIQFFLICHQIDEKFDETVPLKIKSSLGSFPNVGSVIVLQQGYKVHIQQASWNGCKVSKEIRFATCDIVA